MIVNQKLIVTLAMMAAAIAEAVPASPTVSPTTAYPTIVQMLNVTDAPTDKPVRKPVKSPTDPPTEAPTTLAPTDPPTFAPTSLFDKKFTLEVPPLDSSNNNFCLTSFSMKLGALVGMRPCEDKSPKQVWQLDALDQLHLAFDYELCLSVNEDVLLELIECPLEADRRKLSIVGAFKWKITATSLIAFLDNGKKFEASLQKDDKYGALEMVPNGESNLTFEREDGAVPVTAAPTEAPTPDGYTAPPTEFFDQTLYIQSTLDFDDSDRAWCLQAINIRSGANLNVRPCEGRTKQKWLFKDGMIQLAEAPLYCIINVKGKILKMGFCGQDNLAEFSYDEDKGGILALKRETENFYFGFNVVKKYETVRLYIEESENPSTGLWTLAAP